MPQIIHRDETKGQNKTATNSAVVKQKTRSTGKPFQISPAMVAVAGLLALALIVFLIHAYVHPFTPAVREAHKVAPLPGFPDVPPYNVKEWQDMYKSGKATFVSGIPHVQVGGGANAAGATGKP